MSRGRFSKLTRMRGAELRWRLGTAARNGVHRAHTALRAPGWDRRQLASALGPSVAAARKALRSHDWWEAHWRLAEAVIEGPARFPIAPAMRDSLALRISAKFPRAARDAGARADRILAGEFDLLGYRALRFGPTSSAAPDWHLDPVHGRRAPLAFWSRVPFLDPSCGDHKIIWELNRQQHLLVLGRAFWLTGDLRYREAAIAHVSDWIRANPPRTGINWASMLELGFRSLSWIWAIHFFALEPGHDKEPWLVDVLLALDRQLAHIEQNLSYYFSPNTHLLGEALALYVAGMSLPLLRSAQRYAATGRRVLIEQIARQIGRDGGHLERSTHYHRYTLDFYLFALVVARITSDSAAVTFEAAAGRLAYAARLLADSRGRLPHIGDDDGGMLFPLCGRAPDDIRDSLAEASALVDRPELCVGDVPEEAVWLLADRRLSPLLERARTIPGTDGIGSAALPDTGYYVSRSSSGDHLVVDAGPHGYENGGHAHADALSMTLSVRGVPLLIDPGTGSYTASSEARDAFRSSMLHNTVVVDGRSQSVPSGPFHWSHTAQAQAHVWRNNPGFDYLEASHDGYAPLEQRRHVLALHGDLLIVADLVNGKGAHDAQVHWHLDPRWSAEVAGSRALLRSTGERVELAVSGGTLEKIIGTGGPGVGWHAPIYGRLEATSSLRINASGRGPFWVISVFGMNPADEVLVVESIPVWAQAGALERGVGVRISRAHSVDIFGLAAPARSTSKDRSSHVRPTWRVAGYETDARMLFCRSSERVSRLAMVEGSLVRSSDRHTLFIRLPHEAPDLHLDFALARGTQPTGARVGGQVFGAHVQVAGRDLPLLAERRALARATARRQLAR